MYTTQIIVATASCSVFPSLTCLAIQFITVYDTAVNRIATMLFDSYSESLLPFCYSLLWDLRLLPWIPYYDGDIQVTLKAESLYQYL